MVDHIAKIAHLTTVHPSFDTRIFHKEVKTLVKAGYEVTLVAQHDKDEVVDGVKIIALPKPRNRFTRICGLTWRTFRLARRQRAAVYHFHDPELLPAGVLLKLLTHAKVVYDVHEEYPQAIRTKRWLPRPLRTVVVSVFYLLEQLGCRFLDAVIPATESVQSHFPVDKTVLVRNYAAPISTEIPKSKSSQHLPTLIYAGGLSRLRGIYELVQALEFFDSHWDVRLELLGRFTEPGFAQEVRALKGFQRVRFCGWVPYEEVLLHLQRGDIGLVLCHPTSNYLEALPTKLFEYMSAGLPVIVSHFPLWKEIVEGNRCGVTVDPLDPQDIAGAIEYLLEHNELRCEMGENGRRAVQAKYNWPAESEKLTALYERLLSS